jgi:hypothetical protein
MAQPIDINLKLQAKFPAMARRLRDSTLFRGTTDRDILYEKQMLFLALAGVKPVSAAGSRHWVTTDRGRTTAPDDPTAVGDFLESLGLTFQLEVRQHVTLAFVSLDRAHLDGYLASRTDDREAGKWFGYPRTAVEAFATGNLLPM